MKIRSTVLQSNFDFSILIWLMVTNQPQLLIYLHDFNPSRSLFFEMYHAPEISAINKCLNLKFNL